MAETDFLQKFLRILRNCNYDNTYKMAWAKAITEIAVETDFSVSNFNNNIEITLEQIARKVVKYYWNQTIYFDLVQGSNPSKIPRILNLTKSLIEKYQTEIVCMQPIRYEKASRILTENSNLQKHHRKTIKDIAQALKSDVSYRFLNLGNETIDDIYDYTKGANSLYIRHDNLQALKENSQDIFETINYRWALILETFNSTPRICKKVKIIDENEIPRKSLKRFMKYLDLDNPDRICFICGERIEEDVLSIDHVIPWSYLYSDDLWNLVYTHKGCNSSKSNIIPEERIIRKLEERNKRLLNTITGIINDKPIEELKQAIDKNYVYKFWIACQG